MKIVPIRIDPVPAPTSRFIEWQLHNVCNYSCSFCSSRHSGGDKRWLTLEEYKKAVDKLVVACQQAPFWIQLTGGEPTLMPDLADLLSYIKSKGGYTSMISNGSRTIRWWEEISQSNLLDKLFITYHPEQTNDIEHVKNVLEIFHDKPVETLCLITHVKDNLQQAFDAFDFIYENTGSIIAVKAMMVSEYDIYESYSEQDLEKLKRANWIPGQRLDSKVKMKIPSSHIHDGKLLETLNDGTKRFRTAQAIFKDRTNVYTDWMCNVGKTSLRIDIDTLYRGVCSVGGITGKLSDETLKFTDDYVTCDLPQCFCATDMFSTKYRVKKDE